MSPEVLKTIEYTCWVCGSLAGVVAAWFKLRSEWLSKQEDRVALQDKYRQMWNTLRDMQFLELPERGVRRLLNFKRKPVEWSEVYLNRLSGSLLNNENLGFSFFGAPGAICVWILFGMVPGIITFVVSFLLLYLLGNSFIFYAFNLYDGIDEAVRMLGKLLKFVLTRLLAVYVFSSCILLLKLSLTLKIYWTALIMVVIFPIYALLFIIVFETASTVISSFALKFVPDFADKDVTDSREALMNFGFAFSLSFLITAGALLIGSLSNPNGHIPQTLQMFLINLLCDGITLWLTYEILKGGVNRVFEGDGTFEVKRKYPLPIAIALDIFAAAFLACLSLYFGLIGTNSAITVKEALNVLIARSPSGTTYELGPYFWAMHTTFIPTVIYLSIIVLAYIGKLLILPVFHVLRKGHELERPHDLTAAVFTFVAVLFIAIAGMLSRLTVAPVV